jgi:hypothetical protein
MDKHPLTTLETGREVLGQMPEGITVFRNPIVGNGKYLR